jgi:hypothetical protein
MSKLPTEDPHEILASFEKRYVATTFAEEDEEGPAQSDVVTEMLDMLRPSLKDRYIFLLPDAMNEQIEAILTTGLYGTKPEECLERLAAAQLIQMTEDDSPLLTGATID